MKKKHIYVIMPFERTSTRDRAQLSSCFENHIKRPIENAKFKSKYSVNRSEDDFNINEQIIVDLYQADIVIADLSGLDGMPNPNVMYELGIRLAFSDDPVILIREQHRKNKRIFDISGFHQFDYDSEDCSELSKYLINKVRKSELQRTPHKSPIIRIVTDDVSPLKRITRKQSIEQLSALAHSLGCATGMLVGVLVSGIESKSSTKITVPAMEDRDSLVKLISVLKCHKGTYLVGDAPQLPAVPPLENYVASPFLMKTLSSEVASAFYHEVCRFYYRHWARNQIYPDLSMQVDDAISLLEDVLAFGDLYDAVIDLLEAESPHEERAALKLFWKCIGNFKSIGD